MTSKEYTDSIRSMISDMHTNDVNYYGPTFDTISASNQTSNMVVRAPDGGVVVMTNTINTEYVCTVLHYQPPHYVITLIATTRCIDFLATTVSLTHV